MKILALEKEAEGVIPEQFAPHFKNEALKVWELLKKEIVREIYFTKEGHNAVIILECEDETEAEGLLNDLPLVKEGLISFTIIPLVPYDGFERLFK
jgi:hypothetical protein